MSLDPNPPPASRAGADRSAPCPRDKSPAEAAFARVLADARLNSSAKVIASILQDHLRSADHAAAFPSRRRLARIAGWDAVKDRGAARVGRALGRLADCNHLVVMSPGDYWRWQKAIGAPRLGLKPAPAGGNPRRYLVATWKRPEAVDTLWAAPPAASETAREVVDGAHFRAPEIDIRAHDDQAPMSISREAPLSITVNGSKVELGKRTEENNVTVLAPRGEAEAPTSAIPAEEDVARWIQSSCSRVAIVRNVALWQLEDAGRLPLEWVGKVPPRPADPGLEPARPAPALPQLTPSELLENRVRRLAQDGPAADASLIEDLAFDLARAIFDTQSTGFHRRVLAELAAGQVKLEPYLIALGKARRSKKGEGGRAFATFLGPYRPGARVKRPPAGCVLPTHRRAVQTNPH